MAEKQKGRVAIYGCGGAGINTALRLEALAQSGKFEPGESIMVPYYIDTSVSNLSVDVPVERKFLFQDVDDNIDGSGSIRRENHGVIAEHTRNILQKLPPQDLNIVVHSGGGGSGSVIGPSLVSELLARDAAVIVIVIGSADTKVRINNTLNTLKSYDGIVKKRERPVIVLYLENSPQTTREKNDQSAMRAIGTLSFFYSRENLELDRRDLYNVLNFQNATTYPPQVAALNMPVGKIGELSDRTIAVATLSVPGVETALPIKVDYQAVGFLPTTVKDAVKKSEQMHLVVTADLLTTVSRDLTSQLAELDKAAASRVNHANILTDKDNTTDSGLVL